MNLLFTPESREEYQWFMQNDKPNLKRINLLIREIQRAPFEGIGKPEQLRYNLAGYWSRRISGKHRLVYAIEDAALVIIQCRFHY
ncbi:toxin of the YoeB-YefM toxin-antitoxin system [Gammaproteobacteria bacterium]|nr:toxin of the YoeB-YefM toxin-antitoxin system [Gammaproteobacteria bacterium]